jgi:hypothetical protein
VQLRACAAAVSGGRWEVGGGGGGMLYGNAFNDTENAKGYLKIGASGCKAICSALERNTIVTEWWHIRALTVPCYVSCLVLGGRGGHVLQLSVL